jgi:hypothetical protein
MGSYCLLVTATCVPFQEFGKKSSRSRFHCSAIPAKAILHATRQAWGAVRGAFRFRPCIRGAAARW